MDPSETLPAWATSQAFVSMMAVLLIGGLFVFFMVMVLRVERNRSRVLRGEVTDSTTASAEAEAEEEKSEEGRMRRLWGALKQRLPWGDEVITEKDRIAAVKELRLFTEGKRPLSLKSITITPNAITATQNVLDRYGPFKKLLEQLLPSVTPVMTIAAYNALTRGKPSREEIVSFMDGAVLTEEGAEMLSRKLVELSSGYKITM